MNNLCFLTKFLIVFSLFGHQFLVFGSDCVEHWYHPTHDIYILEKPFRLSGENRFSVMSMVIEDGKQEVLVEYKRDFGNRTIQLRGAQCLITLDFTVTSESITAFIREVETAVTLDSENKLKLDFVSGYITVPDGSTTQKIVTAIRCPKGGPFMKFYPPDNPPLFILALEMLVDEPLKDLFVIPFNPTLFIKYPIETNTRPVWEYIFKNDSEKYHIILYTIFGMVLGSVCSPVIVWLLVKRKRKKLRLIFTLETECAIRVHQQPDLAQESQAVFLKETEVKLKELATKRSKFGLSKSALTLKVEEGQDKEVKENPPKT